LPAKHAVRTAGPALIILAGASAVLVLLVVWVAARAIGPAEAARRPWVLPPPAAAAPSTPPVSTSPTPSALITSPSPSRVTTRVSTRAAPRSRKPSPSASSRPSTRIALTATVNVGASWEEGYVAAVRVRNSGNTSRTWSVTVTHSRQRNLTLRNTWNARGRKNGDSVTFTGGPLAPGATADFGYQISKSGRGDARPAGCTVVGGRCSVS
jgi:hypothetical protein